MLRRVDLSMLWRFVKFELILKHMAVCFILRSAVWHVGAAVIVRRPSDENTSHGGEHYAI